MSPRTVYGAPLAYGAPLRSPAPAKPLAACATVFASQLRIYPKRTHARSKCGRYFWNVLPAGRWADCADAASPSGGKFGLSAITRKQLRGMLSRTSDANRSCSMHLPYLLSALAEFVPCSPLLLALSPLCYGALPWWLHLTHSRLRSMFRDAGSGPAGSKDFPDHI